MLYLTDEEDQVGGVDGDELGEGSHQRLVVLHPPGGVDQNDVDAGVSGVVDGLQRDAFKFNS